MTMNQKTSIFSFVKWLSTKYIELEKKTIPNPFKLSGVIEKNNRKYIKVEFSGQAHAIEIEPEVVVEKNIFEYFSAEDKKRIFSLVYNKENFKLSDKYTCDKTNRNMVILTEISTGHKMTLPAENICLDDNLLKQINSKDANIIGYISGTENIQNLSERIKDLG